LTARPRGQKLALEEAPMTEKKKPDASVDDSLRKLNTAVRWMARMPRAAPIVLGSWPPRNCVSGFLRSRVIQGKRQPRDPVVEMLLKHSIPVTRENYLNLAYPTGAPDPMPAELESMLPEDLQLRGAD
jgi:hypothetical protein